MRFSASQKNTTAMFGLRIDADYREPAGGFRPVKITYAWEEGGKPKSDVHVARSPQDTYTITCGPETRGEEFCGGVGSSSPRMRDLTVSRTNAISVDRHPRKTTFLHVRTRSHRHL